MNKKNNMQKNKGLAEGTDVKIFSQDYERAGGEQLFPELEPIGFVHLYWRDRNAINKDYRDTIEDLINAKTFKVPIKQTSRTYDSDDGYGGTYTEWYVQTPVIVAMKYVLAKMNITHVFNFQQINALDLQGDAYRKK